MSRLPLRGRLKAVAVDSVRLVNSPSTRKEILDPTFLMKPIALILLTALSYLSPVFSQNEGTVPHEAPFATTARILGNIPDGTPPPPAPAKPGFTVLAADILNTEIHEQGGRQITVQKISPIALPASPVAEPPSDPTPELLARIAALRAKYPRNEIMSLGATAYRSKDSPPRTLVRIWTTGAEKPVTFWSSADFALLSGCSSFVGSDGATRSLIMMWSAVDIDRIRDLMARKGRQYVPPAFPDLPLGKATFAIASGNPTAENLASIQSLHDVYHNEHARLLTAWQGREEARLTQLAELKANPPKPKDIVLNYFDIDSTGPVPTKGAAR